MATDSGEATAEDLIESLSKASALHELLAAKEVKAALVQELRDIGVPAPGLAYRLVVFAVGGSASFLGGAIASRLQAFIDRTPKLAALLQRISNLHHGAKAEDDLRKGLIAAIRQNRPAETTSVSVDEASSIELVMALHSVRELESVKAQLGGLEETLVSQFRAELSDVFQDMVSPRLSWPDEALDPEALGTFDRLKYTSGIDDFIGRDNDIDFLKRFAGDLSFGGARFNFRWLLLTGDGGSGKTRLAFEFTRKHLNPGQSDHWTVGRLDLPNLRGFNDPDAWRPRQPTFIVVDYAQTAPKKIGELLVAMSRNAKHYDFPVRLLLLERRAVARWTDRMVPDDSNRPMVLSHAYGKTGTDGRSLSPIEAKDTAELMRRRFSRVGLQAPSNKVLFDAASSIDPPPQDDTSKKRNTAPFYPRPLFALAAAEELVRLQVAGEEKKITRAGVLQGIINRERDTRWRLAASDEMSQRQYEMGLALATLVQGLDLSLLKTKEARFGSAATWLPEAPPLHNTKMIVSLGGENAYLSQLEPDTLGEYFLLEALTQSELGIPERRAFLTGAITLNHPWPLVVLDRMQKDFPDEMKRIGLQDAIEQCDDRDAAQCFGCLVPNLVIHCAERGDFSSAKEYVTALQSLRQRFHRDRDADTAHEIGLWVSDAMGCFISRAGAVRRWDDVDEMFSRLDVLLGSYRPDPDFAVAEARTAVSIANNAGDQGQWERIDDVLTRFNKLRQLKNEHIAELEAAALFNVVIHALGGNTSKRVEEALTRFDDLHRTFSRSTDLSLIGAKMACEVIRGSDLERDWNRTVAMLSRLDAFRTSFSDDRRFAQWEAHATRLIVVNASLAGAWGRVDEMMMRFWALHHLDAKDDVIARDLASAAKAIASCASAARDWDRVESMIRVLEDILEDFASDENVVSNYAAALTDIIEIRAQEADWHSCGAMFSRYDRLRSTSIGVRISASAEARAMVHIVNHACAFKAWEMVDSTFRRIDELREAFPTDPDIAFPDANATKHAARCVDAVREWPRFNAIVNRFDRLRSDLPHDRWLATSVAWGIAEFVKSAIAAGVSDRVNTLLLRYDHLRQDFDDVESIARAEAQCIASIIDDSFTAGAFEDVVSMFARFDRLHENFPDNEGICRAESEGITAALNALSEEAWDHVDLLFRRLDGLRSAFPLEESIAEQFALAAIRVATHPTAVARSDRIDQMFARLDALRKALPWVVLRVLKQTVPTDNPTTDPVRERMLDLRQSLESLGPLPPVHMFEFVAERAFKRRDWDTVRKILGLLRSLSEEYGPDLAVFSRSSGVVDLRTAVKRLETMLNENT